MDCTKFYFAYKLSTIPYFHSALKYYKGQVTLNGITTSTTWMKSTPCKSLLDGYHLGWDCELELEVPGVREAVTVGTKDNLQLRGVIGASSL